jgi:alpha-ribazole phosphatase/probable phosphoglycerate mutase
LRQQLTLIRHGITDMAGTLCGGSDPPLNQTGREQAALLALSLRDHNFRRLYTSDLRRAIQTAEVLGQAWGTDAVVVRQLRERHFGLWEGRSWSQIVVDNPGILRPEVPLEFSTPEGESFDCFRQRVLAAFARIAAECNGEPTAVVTHLGVILLAITELHSTHDAGRLPERIGYCSVHSVTFTTDGRSLTETPAHSI